jgi:transmembrane sensor
MTARETADDIEAAAARWVWRRDQEGADPSLAAELESWLSADPRRRGAFLQAEAAWSLLADAAAADVHQDRLTLEPLRLPRRRVLLAGGGAALAASLGGLGFALLDAKGYRTATGEVRRVPLKDGSVAAINTASALRVSLASDRRRIRLDHGEAWFQVAKDPKRPFVVEAGRVRVRAVGTAFSVRRRMDGADVLVTEGVVEAWADGAEAASVRLSAGDKAFVADNAAIRAAVAAPSEIDRRLAWREGRIDLAGETLGEAVAEFNRYNARKLIVSDADLARERLYGVFHTDDPQAFAEAVQSSLGASLVAKDDQIFIDRRPTS